MTIVAPINSGHIKALGRVTANFSMLEFHLNEFTSELISEDIHLGRTILAEVRFLNLTCILRSLYRYRVSNKVYVREFDNLIDEIQNMERERNMVIHSVWYPNPSGEVTRFKKRSTKKGGLKFDVESWDISKIDEVADQIKKLAVRIEQVRNAWIAFNTLQKNFPPITNQYKPS